MLIVAFLVPLASLICEVKRNRRTIESLKTELANINNSIEMIEEDIPSQRKYIGMKFQNEIAKYVYIDEDKGKMYLTVLK